MFLGHVEFFWLNVNRNELNPVRQVGPWHWSEKSSGGKTAGRGPRQGQGLGRLSEVGYGRSFASAVSTSIGRYFLCTNIYCVKRKIVLCVL